MRTWLALFALLLLCPLITAGELRVATLHPLLGDLARQIGGDQVEVIDLMEKDSDPHHFEPTPDQLRKLGKIDLYLASGMSLESYLPSLKTIIPASSKLIVLGDDLPSIEGACEAHDHTHHHHDLDPHWWHSIDTFRRASSLTADAFTKSDPDGAETYAANDLVYRKTLDELERWTRRELARVPHQGRILATTHAAFGYFCKDYGFEAISVSGINREQMPDARTLAKLITRLRENKVRAIFPDTASNPKTLSALTEETGIGLATPLDADGSTSDSYEAMVRHNVGAIVKALK